VPLSSSQTGIIAGEKITYADGAPVSNVDINQERLATGDMLALQTPRGGTYQITLPDGTEVWLNAASTIKYPSQFSPAERTVEVIGEAYFHVKTVYGRNGKKVPFRVLAGQQEIDVLGTHFNVNSYPGQKNVKTTLEEGRVAIVDKTRHIALLPGQQAITADGKTIVKKVNVADYTAWRDGKFSFDDKTFEETMDEIARWYDLHIVYENGIPHEEIVGDAFRNQNIHLVLRLLDAAEISYQLDVPNRKLTIRGKK
jgi:transmembrane sensor